MKSHCFSITIRILVLPLFAVSARAGPILLGAASAYAVLPCAGFYPAAASEKTVELPVNNTAGATTAPEGKPITAGVPVGGRR
jgi:hypothetical protein